MRKILAIDGGGVRGIIPAMMLAEIEQRTGKHIAHLFDLLSGTSAGGILATGLATPNKDGEPMYTANEGVQLFQHRSQELFYRSLWYTFITANGFWKVKYPNKGIDKFLYSFFGDTQLKDALTEVLITAYELETRTAFFFKRHHAKADQHDNYFMRDIIRATTAAPTYFSPARFQNVTKTRWFTMVDGGLYANNPAMCAYIEARKLWPNETDFLVVSLGAGEMTQPLQYQTVKLWGTAQWAVPILGITFDGIADTVDHQMHQLLPMTDQPFNKYWRFQTKLKKENSSFDNTSVANISQLMEVGKRVINDHTSQLDTLCKQLSVR